ncbi:MAG: hypothetical protein KAR38_09550 [Calditrichia bacterium]|nr:hypothetical protein [Calditrichia bacterium]
MIRVGTNSYFKLITSNINRAQVQMFKTRERISSGKQMNSISDRPDKLQNLLSRKEVLSKNNQYIENVNNGLEYLTIVQSELEHSNTIIADVKRLLIEGSDTIGDIEWESFSQRIDQYLKEMVNIGNTKFKDKYVFAGTSTQTIPYTLAGDGNSVSVNATGIDKHWRIEVGKYQMETINISGTDAFQDDVDVYDLLIQIRDAFTNEDTTTLQGLIDEVDSAQSQILAQGAKVGGIINRFELLEQQYEYENINLKSFISEIEDADLLEESMNLQKEELALQAAMTVASRGMNLSLVNYLK